MKNRNEETIKESPEFKVVRRVLLMPMPTVWRICVSEDTAEE